MAVRYKRGLDYFPLNVDFFSDEKIEFVTARFGPKGLLIVLKLLCKIYHNGYYAEWSEDASMLFATRAGEGIAHTLVNDVVQELAKRDFFDEHMLNTFRILTSRGIQNRYFEAVERRKGVEAVKQYLLIDVAEFEYVNIIEQNVNIPPPNADISKQRKEQKSREKKISFEDFWNLYDKKRGDKQKLEKAWDSYPLATQRAIMEYIPKYLQAQPEKRYRKDPMTFFSKKAWQDEIIDSGSSPSTSGSTYKAFVDPNENKW